VHCGPPPAAPAARAATKLSAALRVQRHGVHAANQAANAVNQLHGAAIYNRYFTHLLFYLYSARALLL
jgi:hypothetical protein